MVGEHKESYIESKCTLYEQIYENHDMNNSYMNCFETKCGTRGPQNCESHQEKKVDDKKVSSNAIVLQQDSTLSQMHLVYNKKYSTTQKSIYTSRIDLHNILLFLPD